MSKVYKDDCAAKLVSVMNRLYYNGYTTMSGGNLSQRDSYGNIWITPSGVDKGRLEDCDIVMVKSSGEVVGEHKPSVELPLHNMALRGGRWSAVLHAHPPAIAALSLIGQLPNIDILPMYSPFIHSVSRCEYGLPGSKNLASSIISKINSGSDVVLLDNHGVVVVADDIFSAYCKLEAAEHAAQLMLNLCIFSSGEKKNRRDASCGFKGLTRSVGIDVVQETQLNLARCSEIDTLFLEKELVEFWDRATRTKCIHTFFGAFALRCNDTEFLAVYGSWDGAKTVKYRLDSNAGNIFGSSLGMLFGKSRLGDILAATLRRQPIGGAVAVAIPTATMSFSVAGEQLCSRIIPESYMQLRDIYHMPYEEFICDSLSVAEILRPSCPVVLVEHTFLLAVGGNPTKCYDALEVCEFTANALLGARQLAKLGNINTIDDEEIEKIKLAFNLK